MSGAPVRGASRRPSPKVAQTPYESEDARWNFRSLLRPAGPLASHQYFTSTTDEEISHDDFNNQIAAGATRRPTSGDLRRP
jgi:hypothetical protein